MVDTGLLLSRLGRFMIEFERRLAVGDDARPGLDAPQVGALLALDMFGPLRPGAITSVVNMTSGGTSKVLRRLEETGLVTRTPHAMDQDRRAVVVTITSRGRDAVRGCEQVVSAMAPQLVEVLDVVAPSPPHSVPADAAPSLGPVSAGLFRFLSLVGESIVDVVGEYEHLQPSETRGLVVLVEVHRLGSIRAGALPALLDRSRSATSTLVAQLVDAGLVARCRDRVDGDARAVVLELTEDGRRTYWSVVDALRRNAPALEVAAGALLAAVSPGVADANRTPD
ncbi:MAG: MarR family winged helix-turn-helix transcriptional regulator [Acidimicrobiia bacterium]